MIHFYVFCWRYGRQQRSTEVNGGEQKCVCKPGGDQERSTEVSKGQRRSIQINNRSQRRSCRLVLLCLDSLFTAVNRCERLHSRLLCWKPASARSYESLWTAVNLYIFVPSVENQHRHAPMNLCEPLWTSTFSFPVLKTSIGTLLWTSVDLYGPVSRCGDRVLLTSYWPLLTSVDLCWCLSKFGNAFLLTSVDFYWPLLTSATPTESVKMDRALSHSHISYHGSPASVSSVFVVQPFCAERR